MRGAWVQGGPAEDALDRDEARGVLRRLWKTLRPYRSRVVVAILLLVGQTSCLLAGPWLVGIGIDRGIYPNPDARVLNTVAAIYLLLACISVVLGSLVIRQVAAVGETFLRDLRAGVFRHLLSLGLDFFEREKTGRLVSRMTADIDALQELIAVGLVAFVQNGLIFVGALVLIFLLSWQLALCVLVLVPPVMIASRWFRNRSNRAYLEVRDRVATNLATLQEGLAGVRVVQAFGRERAFTRRFFETNEAQYDANLETVRISVRYFPFMEFIGVVGIAMIIGIGGGFVDRGWVEVGVVAAFVLYLNNLFEPIQQLSQLYDTVQKAGAALHKLFGLLDTKSSITERAGAVDLAPSGVLSVDDVSFAYVDEAYVLRDVTLTIATGERLALVGPTGAGKSTLAKLLVRFYDPDIGSVSYGDVDLRDATLRSLRERIIVVPQEGFLFAGTIRENIRIGRADASDAEIDTAIDALDLTDRFAAMPDGVETEVRERGSRLSGGERQLVSLVRAALADPAVLVLDEATSNLDPGTEVIVERALERLMAGRTVVVVAHRLSTAARCDRIAVVDDGRLVEIGPHTELLARGGHYERLFSAWTSGVPIGHTA
ncbi:MAG TPA: ABC transporter ATP-binding protein [Acidimicrobiia bacterium]|nr:ABC transporter ATP-binding protein [Acidimicrobiia bacterium]